jgi:hypothetical protein
MKEIRKKSAAPIYIVGAIFVVWGLFLPLYALWHFVILAVTAALGYFAARKMFPDKITYVEVAVPPVETGDERIDALLREGEAVVGEMREIEHKLPSGAVREKIGELAGVTEKIFKNVIDDPSDFKQVRRFADVILPTTANILRSYEKSLKYGGDGQHASGMRARIEGALDSILDSFKRQYDALFYNQALDIETDLTVLKSLLNQEGRELGK